MKKLTCQCGAVHWATTTCVIVCRCGKRLRIGKAAKKSTPPKNPVRNPRWFIRWISHYRRPEDTGVGDTVERLLAMAGAERVKRLLERFGLDCGCGNRKDRLNRKHPY